MYNHWDFGDLAYFDYYKLIQFYEKLYGKDNIHSIMQETLRDEPAQACEVLSNLLCMDVDEILRLFCNKKQNIGTTEKNLIYLKVRNLLPIGGMLKLMPYRKFITRTVDRWLETGASYELIMPDEWKSRLGKAYSTGNQYLIENYDLKLHDCGYPI